MDLSCAPGGPSLRGGGDFGASDGGGLGAGGVVPRFGLGGILGVTGAVVAVCTATPTEGVV